MADTGLTPKFAFKGRTVDELRRELNDYAAKMQRELRADTIVVKQIVFVPIEGPHRKADARLMTLFARLEQYNDPTSGNSILHIVEPNATLTRCLRDFSQRTTAYGGIPGSLTD
jgi:hypothetical protein